MLALIWRKSPQGLFSNVLSVVTCFGEIWFEIWNLWWEGSDEIRLEDFWWLFAIFIPRRSFAPFCALLRSFSNLRLRSFALFCVWPRLERPRLGTSETYSTYQARTRNFGTNFGEMFYWGVSKGGAFARRGNLNNWGDNLASCAHQLQ